MLKLKLNKKQVAVFRSFDPPAGGKDGATTTLSDLAGKAFPKKGMSYLTKGNSWVRNSLRKLVKLGLVKGKGKRSGEYFRPASSIETAKTIEGLQA